MIKRGFDLVTSVVVLLLLLPIFLLISLMLLLSDGFPILYRQERIGLNGTKFNLYKFRTMVKNADSLGKISVGKKDPRVTRVGHILRRTKFDEFPQLFNIIKGDMSVVGPRPEVEEYVKLYSEAQKKVLATRPGLTDFASIEYANESEILGLSNNPHKTYVEEIMPTKLNLGLKYIEEKSLWTDLKIIFKTFQKIWS